MEIKYKLRKVIEKTLTLNVQKKYAKQMKADFESQGWEVTEIIKQDTKKNGKQKI